MSTDKDDESIIFAQVDCELDTNPKILEAGNLGRQVFEFILRRNARRGFKGSIPLSHIGPAYLARTLMLATSDDAVTGVTAAVTAKLIAIDEAEGVVRLCRRLRGGDVDAVAAAPLGQLEREAGGEQLAETVEQRDPSGVHRVGHRGPVRDLDLRGDQRVRGCERMCPYAACRCTDARRTLAHARMCF